MECMDVQSRSGIEGIYTCDCLFMRDCRFALQTPRDSMNGRGSVYAAGVYERWAIQTGRCR